MTGQCRACGGLLDAEVLLRYPHMPMGAQNFPYPENIAQDHSVDLEIVQCSCCGLVQLKNAPVSYWRNVIRAVGFSPEMAAFRKKQFNDFVKRYSLIQKYGIELGCGDGAYLELLSGANLNMVGLEYDADNVLVCRKRGLEVQQGFAQRQQIPFERAFDAFFVFSFLEHIPTLRDFLRTIRAHLAQDAVGIIEVPNFDMILQENLFAEFIIDHLFYFTEKTLCHTLENNGFDVISCSRIWHNYILCAEVKKRQAQDVALLHEAKVHTLATIQRFASTHGTIAVWGAGHQSFTLLSMLNDTNAIQYIVDSAPFKQGRVSPVTHIPVVPPETLRTRPVNGLIITGGSYSDEIAKTVHENFSQNNVVIFRNNQLESAGM